MFYYYRIDDTIIGYKWYKRRKNALLLLQYDYCSNIKIKFLLEDISSTISVTFKYIQLKIIVQECFIMRIIYR